MIAPRRSPSRWTFVWLLWFLAFLLVELPGAILPGKGETLSEHVWRWFRGPWRRCVLAAFMVALTAHFVFGASAWWLLTAIPLAGVIVYAELFERRSSMRRPLSFLLAASLCGAAVLVACKDCQKLELARAAACSSDPAGEACKLLTDEWARGCAAEPTPPPPTTTTTTTLPPAPPPTTCVPPCGALETCRVLESMPPRFVCVPLPPPPPARACPTELAPGAEVYLNNKVYGQGLDATVRVRGDLAFCQAIHGPAAGADCHLDGMPPPWTTLGCELELLGKTISKRQACPVWEYRVAGVTGPCVDDQGAKISCDHFGRAGGGRDDPKTPAFEGEPEVCGMQRDAHGPKAGFFTVAHGLGQVRACRPDGAGCGPWVSVDH